MTQPAAPGAPPDRPPGPLARYHQALPGLAGLLRGADLSVGPDRWQNLYDLLAALAAQGRLPAGAAGLAPLIAPLVCRSEQEQQAFPALFARWLEGLAPDLRGPGPAAPAPAAARSGQTGPAPAPRLRWWLLGLMLLFAALLGAAYWAQRPDPPTVAETPSAAVPDVPVTPPPEPPPPNVPPPPPPAAPTPPPAAPAVLPHRPLPDRVLDPDHRSRHAILGAFCLLLPPFVALAWLLLRWLTWRTVLERRRGDPRDPLTAIRLPVAADDLLQAPALREALRHLHQPVSVATRRLDADATVARTARHAGLYRPVTRRRRFVPELVVLVQTRHPGDQMAGLAGQLAARLGEAGLAVQRYDYRDSPRTAVGADGRRHTIADLLARHAGARLLLIGEAAALLDPLSGRPQDWTAALAAAPSRALLATRRPPAAWERALSAAGFALAEVSSRGLETLAWHLSGLGRPAGSALPATARPLPRLLQDARRWSQPVPPPPAERAALLRALDDFLGPEGAWLLAAMAAYPQLHWGLTRVLDLHLFPPPAARAAVPGALPVERGPAGDAWSDREGRLLRIARLPWCRLGWLPDWLRAALLGRLGRPDQRAVRRVYRALLQRATTAPGGPGEVAIALPVSLPRSAGLLAGLWDWLRQRGWRLDRWLQGQRALSDGRGVLDDAIFADCLFGWRPRLLDFIAPRPLLRRLLGGALGQALAPRLLLALVLGGGGAWLAGLAWQEWLAARAEPWFLDRQHGVHHGYRVAVQCREATAALADDLRTTLEADGFVVQVGKPLPAGPAAPGPRPILVNRVQWDDAADALLAAHVADRLARLAGGEPPRVTNRLPRWGHGLRPVSSGGLRAIWVVLETDGGVVVSVPEPADPEPLPVEPAPVTILPTDAAPDQGTGTPAVPDAGQRLMAQIQALETTITGLEAELRLELAGRNGRPPGRGPAAKAVEGKIKEARTRLADLQRQGWPLLSESDSPVAPDPRSVFRDRLQSGGEGPAMVRLPGGDFLMGSPEAEPERYNDETQHRVAIKPFAIGRNEVSFAEYDRFAAAKGRAKPVDGGWGRGDRPVINVSWDDATDYAAWLSAQTGRRYRLPTEAEWEYAARAGTQTPFWTGDCIHTDQANYNGTYDYNGCGAKTGVYRQQTVPVDSLAANPWGLHQVAGNVWEWTCSAYADPYDGKETVCISKNDANTVPTRVFRGGAWNFRPARLRSAYRAWAGPSNRLGNLGFRLAQDL